VRLLNGSLPAGVGLLLMVKKRNLRYTQ